MHIHMFRQLCFLTLLIVASLFAHAAHAKPQCLPIEYQQRNAAQVYLIRLTQVGYVPMSGDEYARARVDTRGARFQVEKIYQGDIAKLKDLGNAMLEIHCNNVYAVDCRVLEKDNYPFQAGQLYVIYDAPSADGLLTLKLAACPGSWQLIQNEEVLADFETLYSPIWERSAVLAEEGSDDESGEGVKKDEESTDNTADTVPIASELPPPLTP